MFEVKKNDKAYAEIKKFSESINLGIKETLLSDEHLQEVSTIFYKHIPIALKFAVKPAKFTEFYKQHREVLVEKMGI